MTSGTLGRQADGLKLIAARMELPELQKVIKQPGVTEAYRITVQYHDGRFADQVATLTRTHFGDVTLTVHYRRYAQALKLVYSLDFDSFREFDLALRRLDFDRQDDQPRVPVIGMDRWLIERASGSFLHDVVLAPETAEDAHLGLIEAVRTHLPEALRAFPPT